MPSSFPPAEVDPVSPQEEPQRRDGPLGGPRRARDRWIAHLRASGVHQRWILFAGLAGMFAGGFTFTVLAVSLKNIAEELGSTETTLAWVVTAPILVSAIALPLLGKLGDMYGHRRVFLLGSGAATLLSFATVGAWDAYSLIGLRVAASVIGAASGPSSMALIFTAYSPAERTRAMGWWSMMGAGAPALGLIAGGPMVQYMGWRMLFVVQGVFSVLALALAWFVLVETARLKVRLDVLGSVLLAVSAGCLMFALSQVGELGPSSPWIWGAIALAAVFVYGFVRVEEKTEEPLLPLQFFSYRNFTAPILSNALQNGAYLGAFVLAPFLLQNVFELDLVSTSLFMLLRTLTLTLTSPLGGVLGTRVGNRRASMIGTGTIMISMAVLATGASTEWIVVVGAGLVLQGTGQGLCGPSLNAAVAGAVPPEHLGVATAAKNLFGQIVTAFGIALLAGLYAGGSGFQSAFFAGGVMALLALCAASFMKKDRPRDLGGL